MHSSDSVSAYPQPSQNTANDSLAPASIARPPQKKGNNTARLFLGIGGGCLSIAVLGCVVSGFLAHTGATDFGDEPFVPTAELYVNGSGAEAVRIRVPEGPDFATYNVAGFGTELATGCDYLTDGISEYDTPCETAVDGAPTGDLIYNVTGRGLPSRFLGFPYGDRPSITVPVTVSRPYGYLWSEPRGATICTGATCTVGFRDGNLELRGAQDGTQLEHNGRMGTAIAVETFSLVDRAGLSRVLTAQEGRAEVPEVRVILTDGAAVSGSVEVTVPALRQAWFAEFANMADEGNAPVLVGGGTAGLWIENGQMRETTGSPTETSQIGTVVVETSERRQAARCGPYINDLFGTRSFLNRTRTDVTVAVINRHTGGVSRRRFRGRTPRCPQSIPSGQTNIHGDAPDGPSDYARDQLNAI